MARACILMALAPVKVPAAWLLSLSTASSALEWSRPRGFAHPVPGDDALRQQPVRRQGEGAAEEAGHKGRVGEHFVGGVGKAHHLLQVHLHLPELGPAGRHGARLAGPVHLHPTEHRLAHIGLVHAQPPHGIGRAGAGLSVQPVEQGALLHRALQDLPGKVRLV